MNVEVDMEGIELGNFAEEVKQGSPSRKNDPIGENQVVIAEGNGKSRGRCCGVIRTPLQCVPACNVCSGFCVIILGAITLIADRVFSSGDNSQLSTEGTILGAGLMLLGAIVVVGSCGDFFLIRHYKPQKDLEGQLDDYKKLNFELTTETRLLKENTDRLDNLTKNFSGLLSDQKKKTKELKADLEMKVNELQKVEENLGQVAGKVESAEDCLKGFSKETKEAKKITDRLMDSNQKLNEMLQKHGIQVEALEEQKLDLEEGVEQLSAEKEEFQQHAAELQNLVKRLDSQLIFIERLIETLDSGEFIKQANRFDEYDDKTKDGSEALERALKEKERLLIEEKQVNNGLLKMLKGLKIALLKVQHLDFKSHDEAEIKGIFLPMIQLIEKETQSSEELSSNRGEEEL